MHFSFGPSVTKPSYLSLAGWCYTFRIISIMTRSFKALVDNKKKKRLRFKQFCNPCKSSLFWNTFMWINSNDHFKLNRTKKEQYNSRRIDGNRKNFPCALENSATNSVSWFLIEKKKESEKNSLSTGANQISQKTWVGWKHVSYVLFCECRMKHFNLLIKKTLYFRFHFLYTAGEPLFQKHWSTRWVSKSLKWLKKKWN